MKKILRVFFLGTFIYSVIQLGLIGYEYYHATEKANELKEVVRQEKQLKYNLYTIDSIPFGVSNISLEKLKKRNSDLIGYLHFDSGIISEPIVRGKDNSYYLKHDLDKKWSAFGTVFMDYENVLEDENISLYGHSSKLQHLKFQPLNRMYREDKLLNENLYFSLHLDKEIRRYKIAYLYDYGEFNIYDHRTRNFSNEKEFKEFKDFIIKRAKVKENIDYKDKFISLQVCLDWNIDKRVIVVGKEVERIVKKTH